jgi:hypothetical protein
MLYIAWYIYVYFVSLPFENLLHYLLNIDFKIKFCIELKNVRHYWFWDTNYLTKGICQNISRLSTITWCTCMHHNYIQPHYQYNLLTHHFVNENFIMRIRLMVFNTTFNNISLISLRYGQFYWWRKSDDPAKATFTMSGMQKTYLFPNWFHFAII